MSHAGAQFTAGALRAFVCASVLLSQPVAAVGQKSGDMLSTQYLLQVVGSLLLVLAAVFVLAWVLKRFGAAGGRVDKSIQVLASTRLSGREKLMLVRVANQLLVLGVAPGNLRTLHTFPADAELNVADETSDAGAPAAGAPAVGFAALLQAASQGRSKT